MSRASTLSLGDYLEDYATLNFMFNIERDDTGAPIILAGSPVVTVLKGSNTTGKTSSESYITLDLDYASVVGLCHVLIDLSGDAFFAAAEDYSVVLTTGTVNSVVKSSQVLATFSIENRSQQVSVAAILVDTAKIGPAVGDNLTVDIAAVKTETAAVLAGTVTNAAGADVAADIIAIKAETAAIVTDTGEIGTGGAGLGDLGGMSTAMKAEVNVESKDVLDTDTHAEPAQGAPGATLSTGAKIDWLYKNWRNKKEVTSSEWRLMNDDASTVDTKAAISDDGTTADIAEKVTGP